MSPLGFYFLYGLSIIYSMIWDLESIYHNMVFNEIGNPDFIEYLMRCTEFGTSKFSMEQCNVLNSEIPNSQGRRHVACS